MNERSISPILGKESFPPSAYYFMSSRKGLTFLIILAHAYSLAFFKRSAFATTIIDEALIRRAAHSGLKSIPKEG
jgi:hypothetical protein